MNKLLQTPIAKVIGAWLSRGYRCEINRLAGNLAFSTVLGLVPLTAVLLGAAGFFGYLTPALQSFEPKILESFAAGQGEAIIAGLNESVARLRQGALGRWGFLTLILLSGQFLGEIQSAVRKIWDSPPPRTLWKRWSILWSMLFVLPLTTVALVTLASSSFLRHAPYWLVTSTSLLVLLLVFTIQFKVLPRQCRYWTSALLGACVTTLGLWLLQSFYGWITAHLLNYDRVYGSLSSLFIFLIWVLSAWHLILWGVALSATIELRSEDRNEK